ncbi:hypothetical protein F2P81_014800 [Scophthalmus maximus]|uniref:Activating transcription factor 7-interacting protein Fn3 domain-containing protein n=1 Tax=Scophthalmus maximus TaxID=52904 RepID=A0A6A4SKY1_SCOMX|nr:hypothetical protein F2P81_014800 [Scophthalmus maximus]
MFAPLKLWKFGFYCERARPEVGGTKSRHDAGDHPVSGLSCPAANFCYRQSSKCTKDESERMNLCESPDVRGLCSEAFQDRVKPALHLSTFTHFYAVVLPNFLSIKTRINTLTKRTEAALAHMTKTQKKSQHPSPVNVDIIRIDSEDEAVETVSQSKESMDRTGKSGEFLQVMKNVDKSRMTEEPEAATMRVESPSSGRDNIPKHTGSGQRNVKLLYPPLPSTTVPSVLDSEAASFNIPQRPEVHLALIRDPPGLSVLWKVVEEDPCAPPMDSYSCFMTSEKVKGSGVFRKWKMLGEVKAITLPMCVMVTKYKPGHKYEILQFIWLMAESKVHNKPKRSGGGRDASFLMP